MSSLYSKDDTKLHFFHNTTISTRHFTFHRRTTNWIKRIRFDFMCNACFIFMFTLPSWGQWTVLTRTRCLHISLILVVIVYKWRNHHLPFSSSKLAEVQYHPSCRYVNEWWILFSCISKKLSPLYFYWNGNEFLDFPMNGDLSRHMTLTCI